MSIMKGIRGDVDNGDEEQLSIYVLITLFGRSSQRWPIGSGYFRLSLILRAHYLSFDILL
jgi:hypothetical protein